MQQRRAREHPRAADIVQHPSKALDIHHFSPGVLRSMFAPAIGEFLGLIFQSKAFASQTLGFLRGSAQEGHQDSAYVLYTIPRQFAASWIALEDVTLGAGELFDHVGSHRLEDFTYGGADKSVAEARRMNEVSQPGWRWRRMSSRSNSGRRRAACRRRCSLPSVATC